jgi:hypothetical protein
MSTFVVMGTSGEYSDRSEWPCCVVADEETARALVVRFQSEVRALVQEWKRIDLDCFDDGYAEKLQLLLKLLPDPAIRRRYASDDGKTERELSYIRADQWSCYYVEVSGPPDLGPPLTDAREAMAA